MKLPVEFTDKMRLLLGAEEFESFMKSYDMPRYYGLRVNTLKISVEDFLRISPFKLEPIPWTKDGFYYSEGESPGRHPYYYAGLYYIQEPSAMLPAEVLDAKPGERVLDLCAAPGGKTVQIAAGMKGQGLLVANDINSDRVKALVKNVELCGVRNVIVTNDLPGKLAVNFKGFFDRILVDAPCSGEGMFRKDEDAARSWESFKCDKCSCMQWEILQHVDRMLKPGGTLVYSTCTFSPEEDEKMIARFMDAFGYYELADISKLAGIAGGRPEWADGRSDFVRAARLWPHKLKGEGHFVALLRKSADAGANEGSAAGGWSEAGSKAVQSLHLQTKNEVPEDSRKINISEDNRGIDKQGKSETRDKKGAAAKRRANHAFSDAEDLREVYKAFERDNLNISLEGSFITRGSNLYHLPVECPDLSGIKVAKFGWYLGEASNGRFNPSHSLVTALGRDEARNILNLEAGSQQVISYLKGETLMLESPKGLTAMCVDGYTLGWAKQSGGMLKNLYPKGWRKMG